MKHIIPAALILAAGALSAMPAQAGDAKLAWKDLDLATASGRAELASRIDGAATALCTREPVTGHILRQAPSARCLAEARDVINARLAARIPRDRLAAAPAGASEARR